MNEVRWYEISFVGYDGLSRSREVEVTEADLKETVIELEERGAHSIYIFDSEGEEVDSTGQRVR